MKNRLDFFFFKHSHNHTEKHNQHVTDGKTSWQNRARRIGLISSRNGSVGAWNSICNKLRTVPEPKRIDSEDEKEWRSPSETSKMRRRCARLASFVNESNKLVFSLSRLLWGTLNIQQNANLVGPSETCNRAHSGNDFNGQIGRTLKRSRLRLSAVCKNLHLQYGPNTHQRRNCN